MYSHESQPKKQSGYLAKIFKGILIIGVLFITLIGIIAIAAPKTSHIAKNTPIASTPSANVTSMATEDPTATAIPTATPTPVPILVIGQNVMVGEVRWKILAAENLGDLLSDENQFTDNLKTSGKFIKVRFEIENHSKDMLTFAGLELIDNQERSFTYSSDAIMVIDDGEACILENLNPNIAKTCTHIYEVPTDATGLNAVASNLSMVSRTEVLIGLGM